ncbi:MAG: hypothetical protein PWR10_1577 [Halanaerobiales bacterium]|nr:hypothetical protein [Halanaerobiales bacterium]
MGEYDSIINKIEEFVTNEELQTYENATEIFHDPMYRKYIKFIGPKENARSPILKKFRRLHKQLVHPKFVEKYKDDLIDLGFEELL